MSILLQCTRYTCMQFRTDLVMYDCCQFKYLGVYGLHFIQRFLAFQKTIALKSHFHFDSQWSAVARKAARSSLSRRFGLRLRAARFATRDAPSAGGLSVGLRASPRDPLRLGSTLGRAGSSTHDKQPGRSFRCAAFPPHTAHSASFVCKLQSGAKSAVKGSATREQSGLDISCVPAPDLNVAFDHSVECFSRIKRRVSARMALVQELAAIGRSEWHLSASQQKLVPLRLQSRLRDWKKVPFEDIQVGSCRIFKLLIFYVGIHI